MNQLEKKEREQQRALAEKVAILSDSDINEVKAIVEQIIAESKTPKTGPENQANEHRFAFERANMEAGMKFNRCPICGSQVCDDCFIFRSGSGDLCKKCMGRDQ